MRGKPLFGIDQRLPGMRYAVIARAPRFDAEVVSVDDSAALAVPGVLRTMRIEGPGPGGDYSSKPIAAGVAVIATSLWAAMKEIIPALRRQLRYEDYYITRHLPPTAAPYRGELHDVAVPAE